MTGWRTPTAIIACLIVALGWFTHALLTVTLLAVLLVLAVAGAAWKRRRNGSAALVDRWSARSKKHHGVASPWTILRVSSGWAMRRKAHILRPSLADLSWWKRLRTPVTEFATPLIRTGWLRVFSPVEDVTVGMGGPRVGKTGELCCRILDAPGAVIATSTRTDLIENTSRERARKGPVYIFNPSGIGNLPSTITFSPLAGCEDPAVATARATDLLSATARNSSGDTEHWLTLARISLAPLLHAAALGNLSMRHVSAWVADPGRADQHVMKLLSGSPLRVFDHDARQFFEMGEKTRSSVCAMIRPALAWLTDPKAAAACSGGNFDVARLLRDRGTVYLLGAEDAQLAPVVTALTGHIAREARRIAGTMPKGRLDPPLTLALDEAALICPIPLDKWTADMGGRNITIHIRAQSRAQLRQRWGDEGARAILNNAATFMIFGGTRDEVELAAYSALAGDRWEGTRRIPLLTAAQIGQLPAGHAMVMRRGMPPVIGRPLMVWRRRRFRKHLDTLAYAWAARRAAARQRRLVPPEKPMLALPVSTIRHTQRDTVRAQAGERGA